MTGRMLCGSGVCSLHTAAEYYSLAHHYLLLSGAEDPVMPSLDSMSGRYISGRAEIPALYQCRAGLRDAHTHSYWGSGWREGSP